MKNVLFYSRTTPVENYSPTEILLGNKFMSNSGNLLFAASVARSVMVEGVRLAPFFSEDIKGMLTRVDEINEKYECVVIPLANAFRWNYLEKLRNLTALIRAVRIPCYVIGVGIQATDQARLQAGFSFDDDVREFVSAVLEKSPMLGVRGGVTADYLKQLGFLQDQHFTVIGCPSAYIHGEKCRKIQVKPYDALEKVSFNAKLELPRNIHDLIGRSLTEFEDIHFILQDLYEYWAMYFSYRRGKRTKKIAPGYYPYSDKNPIWKNKRAVGFLRAADWLSFMEEQDFSFGSRIHGNMAAITAGTPALIAVSDLRILELVRYHGIPYVWKEDICPETKLRELYEKADFAEFERLYARNFENYVRFLNKLGVQHIYNGNVKYEEGDAPYDRALAACEKMPIIHSNMLVSVEEKIKGFKIYPMMLRYAYDKYKMKRNNK